MSAAGAGEASPWAGAALAAALFAVDPAGTGGVALRGLAGPVRDRWLALLRELLPPSAPVRRLPLGVGDGRLLGGLDLTATLRAGRPVAERSILGEVDGGVVVAAMAERLTPSTAARLASVLDLSEVRLERDGLALRTPTRIGVVALDEGMADDERPPAALLERLAFQVDLGGVGPRDELACPFDQEGIAAARRRLPGVAADTAVVEALCEAAMVLGVASVRASLLALRVARAAAALAGRNMIAETDAAAAGRLVLAHRATTMPAQDQPRESEAEDSAADAGAAVARNDSEAGDESGDGSAPLGDLVVAASQAAMPAGLLARLRVAGGGSRRATSSGRAGGPQRAPSRGRPVGVRRGEPRSGARLNVVETLRAAAPWQPLRRRAQAPPSGRPPRVEVRPEDFRVTRLKHRTRTTAIFVVDASGSSAVQRLAEAKGAVELLLADCYVRRDQVALLGFRGQGAELLLPPTRSLVRAKRGLASLPGGGGTPLATAIDAGLALAAAARRKGETPVVVLLTDGRANIARDGSPGRARAEEDALLAARLVRDQGLTSLLVDTSPRPQGTARRLAAEMRALYLPLPLPRADAIALSRAVRESAAAP
jgi:magnesium chelatase subunit D